ncbi:hypothetical protein NE646_14380, partial [Bittarella massiliensis]|nr:hypothetical protein [Bittarella massiliensis (ex Durand et al. 2017)]
FPDLTPKIAWNQPMFTDHGTFIIGFSAAKAHLAVAPERAGIQGSAVQSPVTCHDGRVFTGSYRTGGVYACFDTADENPASATEVKPASEGEATVQFAAFTS